MREQKTQQDHNFSEGPEIPMGLGMALDVYKRQLLYCAIPRYRLKVSH